VYVTQTECDQYTDKELITKSLAEIAFFTCIYERYATALIRYARRLGVTSADEAEDILQDAFVNVWNHLNTFDPALQFSSWLYRIVHNQVISHFRKQQSYGKHRNPVFEESKYANIPAEENDHAGELADPEKHLRTILSRMSPKYRQVLVLKFLEEKNYVEISDILKIPEGTVATRINRAKKAFRKLAEEQNIPFQLKQES
jgi:RNA polymerase sigma-70 factor (ECF subfamily)